MRWMPINEQPSLIPIIPISRRDFSFFALVAQMEALHLLLPSRQMFTPRLIRPLALSVLNGEDQLSSHQQLVHHRLLKALVRIGRVDFLISTRLLSHPTRMKLGVVNHSAEGLHHRCDNQAPNRSSCASLTMTPAEMALAAVKLLLHLLDTNTPNRLMPLPSLNPLPRLLSDVLQTPAGLEQHPQHQLLHLHRTTSMVLMVLMAWHLSDLPTALVLMADLSTITVCRHPSRHIPSTKHLHCTTSTPRWLLPEPRTDLLDPLDHLARPVLHHRLPWLRLPCRGWTIDPLRLDPSVCENGKRSLLPRSRLTRRTGFASMTCVTEDRPHLLVIATAVTHLKPDVSTILADPKSHAAKSPADPNQPLVMLLRATILLMLLTTLPAMLLALAICHQCNKGPQLPCPESFMTSLQLRQHLRRNAHQVLNMPLLSA